MQNNKLFLQVKGLGQLFYQVLRVRVGFGERVRVKCTGSTVAEVQGVGRRFSIVLGLKAPVDPKLESLNPKPYTLKPKP